MGTDLLTGLSIILAITLVAFVATVRLSRERSPRTRNLIGIGTIAIGTAYFCIAWNQPLLAQLIPTSGLIVLGNWFPVFAAVLAGLVHVDVTSPVRRAVPIAALSLVAAGAMAYPMLGARPECGAALWQRDVCLQTSPHTCSPASAATLLRMYGIEASEAEMAELCMTRGNGTNWMGLYRGLSLKTRNTPWCVEVFEVPRSDLSAGLTSPAILVARLPEDAEAGDAFQDASGWVPGQAHSVVFLRCLNDRLLEVGDPSFGRELWRRRDLDVLWTGRGIRLVSRDSR